MRRRHFGLVLGLGAMLMFSSACDDDAPAPMSDAALADFAGDAKTGDGAQKDGAKPADLPITEGWVPTESGVIQVGDGGVIITEDGGNQVVCYPTKCAGKLLACGDCIDNDGDGKVDWRDPECLGPCDNTEGPGLESGVGGTTAASCGVDCYFDYGNGPGNDECNWDHRCDPLQPELPGCAYDKSLLGSKKCPATQDPLCAKVCGPMTPNGCDCFGCCTFPDLAGKGPNGTPGYVWIGAMDASNQSTCTLTTLTDPAKCPACTPVENCLNECGKCEICVGKPTLPPECFPKKDAGVPVDANVPKTEAGIPKTDGPVPTDGSVPTKDGGTPSAQCPGGEQPCGLPGQALCQQGFYCITGCCIRVIIN